MARGISILERKQDRSQQGTPPLEHEMTHLSASHIDTYVQYNTREKLLNKDNIIIIMTSTVNVFSLWREGKDFSKIEETGIEKLVNRIVESF